MDTRAARPGERDATSTVTEHEDSHGHRFVRITGRLPVGWLGSLSLGIAEAGLSIERGRARRADRQRWEIELELDAGVSGRRLEPVDYLRLASRPHQQAPRPIVVDDYAIDRDPERGALVLDVRGVDCVGFLGSLLDRLTGLLLFPVELEIETVGAHAVDRLCLQALGGGEPSVEAEQMLGSMLAGLKPALPPDRRTTPFHATRMSPRAGNGLTRVGSPFLANRERGLDC